MALSANQLEILIKARDNASVVVSKVNKNMQKLGSAARKVGSAMTSAFGSVLKSIVSLKSGFITLAGAAGLGYAINRTYEYIDALGKTSRRLGVTTDDLQRLQYAAKLSGIEQNTLEMALQRFTRRAAEAGKGTGEAKDALAQMGIQLKDNNGNMRSTESLLGDVADAFSKVQDPSERLRLAFKLFDSEGTAMVEMLGGGKVGLQNMTTEAERLGVVLSENTIAGVERANNALSAMGSSLGGVWNKLTASLAPALEAFGQYWATFVSNFSAQIQPAIDWINTNLQNMATDLDGAAEMGAKWGAIVRDWIIKVVEKLRNLSTDTSSVFGKWEEFYKWATTDGKSMWNSLKTGAEAVSTAINDIKGAMKGVIDFYKKYQGIINVAAGAIAGAKVGSIGGVAGAAIGAVVGGAGAYAATRASGGGVMGGNSYLVGENGPEVFTPSKTGNISNNTGGTTVVNNIYTSATSHGINNALASRGDSSTRAVRVGMNVSNARNDSGYGNLSAVRTR